MVKCSYCSKASSRERINHSFPLGDPTLLTKWLENMRIVDGWTPTIHSRLCSDHFLADCYKTNPGSSRRTLKKNSVPTVFLETTRQCTYCKASKTDGQVKRSFHKFPLTTPLTLAKWLRNMAIKDWYPTEESRLCSDHFEPSSIRLEHGKIRLRDGSIPTIFSTESRMRHVASISQTPPAPEVTELDRGSLQQSTNIDETAHSMNPLSNSMDADAEPASDSSESLMTCPQCNHTFNSEGLTENSKREPFSNENRPKRPRTNGQMGPCEIGFSTPQKESGLAAISNADEKRLLTTHDHGYEISSPSARKKLQSLRDSNKNLRKGLKLEKQKNNRMKKRITSLQEVVGKLRRNRSLPVTSLACFDTIAETDVSEPMKRF